MSKKIVLCVSSVILLCAVPADDVSGFPIGISAHAGLGKGYYSMEAVNDNLNELRLEYDANLSDLTNGTNVMLQGRLWFFDRVAGTVGYEHFWGETEIETVESTIMIKTPADVFSIGALVTAISIPDFVDMNVGASFLYISSIYGTNQEFARRLDEYKANDTGYGIYGEAMTNFIEPLKFGLMIGYRILEVQEYEDRYGDIGFLEPSEQIMEVDYSGLFFYVTAGVGF